MQTPKGFQRISRAGDHRGCSFSFDLTESSDDRRSAQEYLDQWMRIRGSFPNRTQLAFLIVTFFVGALSSLGLKAAYDSIIVELMK